MPFWSSKKDGKEKDDSNIGLPYAVEHKEAVVADSNGIPLNIPNEYMIQIISQVLNELKQESHAGFENSTDKVAVAAMRKINELQSLGEESLANMTDDTMAQIVFVSMSQGRELGFAKREVEPSPAQRETMLIREPEPEPEVEKEDAITTQDIAKVTNIEMKVELFKAAIKNFVVERPPDTRYSKPIEKLGQGGSGTVYHCIDNLTTEHVAIKAMVLRKQPKLELLLEELRLMRTLEHENIINFKMSFLRDTKKTDANKDTLYVVMEYLDGNALYALLCNKDNYYLSETEIAYMSRCTLRALSFLHSKGMIHRDIKSDNILVGKDGRCKLTDFGFCARLEPNSLRKTQIGTPCWMAPEMLHKRGYDHRIDLWSFGITLIECIDLDPPFINKPPMEAMVSIAQLKDLPPIVNWSKCSSQLQDFIKQHLVLNQALRSSCLELLDHPFLTKSCDKEHFGVMVKSHSKSEFA